jgi:hypothetical protein
MAPAQAFTPEVLIELYALLSVESKHDFLKRLARIISAEGAFLVATELSKPELFRYSEMLRERFPSYAIQEVAMQLARDRADWTKDASDKEFADEIFAQAKRQLEEIGNAMADLGRDELKQERDPKPRNTDRDDEIVRLRDQEGKTFGEIPRLLLQQNSQWCRKGGKQLTRDTVEKAYRRRKGLGTN